MAKGKGAALAVIALLLGAGGVGFAFYSWYTRPEIPPQPQFWSNYNETIYYPPTTTPYGNVITIEFELAINSTLHLLYTGSTKILADPVSYADIFFKYAINGELLDDPFTRAGPYQGSSTYDFIPVTLQHVLVNAAPGYYNITVQAYSEAPGNLVRHNVFTITAYPI